LKLLIPLDVEKRFEKGHRRRQEIELIDLRCLNCEGSNVQSIVTAFDWEEVI